MGPKKQIKKEVIEEPPKVVEPEIPAHELAGYGRFDYGGGAFYIGSWKLFNGIKKKHGQGTLTVQVVNTSRCGKELYEGNWQEDEFQGEGTYYYPDGSVYKGSWKHNKQDGHGVLDFVNGTIYEGEWKDNVLHGTGTFIDHKGKKWQGEFRRGKFQSKNQNELLREKAINLLKVEIKKQVDLFITAVLQAIAKSDKKTLKDNLAPFFPTPDNAKDFLKEPYSKFDERPPQKWTDLLNIAKSSPFKILSSAHEATVLPGQRVLGKQLEGNGQVVQITGQKDEKVVKLGVVKIQGNKWVFALALEEEKKK